MMSLSPQRLARLAHDLAAHPDHAVQQAITPYDVETRVAIRHAIAMAREAQGLTLDGAAEVPGRRLGEQDGSYWLRRLQVQGPIDPKTLEAKMSAAGLAPELRMEIKCEAMERRWLSRGLGYRVSAASELATDDATVTYGSEPLSVQMRGLYRRVGLEDDRSYTPQEINEALERSDLPPTYRMALRQELHLRRQVRASSHARLAEQLATLRALQRRRQRL